MSNKIKRNIIHKGVPSVFTFDQQSQTATISAVENIVTRYIEIEGAPTQPEIEEFVGPEVLYECSDLSVIKCAAGEAFVTEDGVKLLGIPPGDLQDGDLVSIEITIRRYTNIMEAAV